MTWGRAYVYMYISFYTVDRQRGFRYFVWDENGDDSNLGDDSFVRKINDNNNVQATDVF